MLEIAQFACLEDNYGFLIHDPATGETAAIDTPDADAYLAAAKARGWTITQIWNTHWHMDHAGGNEAIIAATDARVTGPQEVSRLTAIPHQVVGGGETVALGSLSANVIDVGGHTLGHIAYHFPADDVAFVGDSIFALGCGRLFEGSAAQAWESLTRIMALPDSTKLYCAHEYTEANARFCASLGVESAALDTRIAAIKSARSRGEPTVPTSVGLERATSPFVLADEKNLRRALDMTSAPAGEVFAEVRRRKDVFKG
jgi:hydroxyacylglutathione hydrolase